MNTATRWARSVPTPETPEKTPRRKKLRLVANATTQHDLPASEKARLAKITTPGQRYKPLPIGIGDVVNMRVVKCCGEAHRIVLLTSGRLVALDHSRAVFRGYLRLKTLLPKEPLANVPPCAHAFLEEIANGTKKDYATGMIAKAREARGRVNRATPPGRQHRVPAKVRGVKPAAVDDAFRRKVVSVAAPKLTQLVQNTFKPSWKIGLTVDDWTRAEPDLVFRKSHRRVNGATVYLNTSQWYVRVEQRGFAKLDGHVVLKILEESAGRPTLVWCLRPSSETGGTRVCKAYVLWDDNEATVRMIRGTTKDPR